MLEKNRKTPQRQAWLVSERIACGLKVRGFSETPEPRALNFYAPDFSLKNPQPWLIGEELESVDGAFEPLPRSHLKSATTYSEFAQQHHEILKKIKDREFQKVVPFVVEELEFEEPLSPLMFGRPEYLPTGQFSYGFAFESEGLVGITPELLFAAENGRLTTMALAGTGPKNGPSLLNSTKDTHEHEVVIENICTSMRDFGEVHVGETHEAVFGILKHLRTPITVKLNTWPRFEDLVIALHPTAALGGWPKEKARHWLESQRLHSKRGRFGAPFGFQSENQMVCVVAIRCLEWKGHVARIHTGCGVVDGSLVENEWQELMLKREAVHRQLGIFFEKQ